MNQIIDTIYHCHNGDVVFKNTEMDDKGKNFFMRLVNEITTGWTNLRRWVKGEAPIRGKDHTEVLFWNGTTLETHSSVNGIGVRSQNFVRWIDREGSPEIVILRRPERFTTEQIDKIQSLIKKDRGIPYALGKAIKYGLTPGKEQFRPDEYTLQDRGLFCVEATLRLSLIEKYGGMWPDEAFEYLISLGYYVAFEGNSSELLQIN